MASRSILSFLGPGSLQAGQAMTEFLVVAVTLLIPLFVMIPVLAKIISQSHDMHIGARYAAWERTAWYHSDRPPPHGNTSAAQAVAKSDQQVAHEIDSRIFATGAQPVVSGAGTRYRLDPFLQHLNPELDPLLHDYSGNTSVNSFSRQASEEQSPGGTAGAMNRAVEEIGEYTRFDLNTEGLYTAQVDVDLIDLTDIFGADVDMSALRMTASNSLFVEAWEAGGTEHARYLIGGLTPQQYMDTSVVEHAQNRLGDLPQSEEFAEGCLVFGHASIEPIPGHRLSKPDPRLTAVRGPADDADCGLEHPTEDDD